MWGRDYFITDDNSFGTWQKIEDKITKRN